jgi:ribonuclease-3
MSKFSFKKSAQSQEDTPIDIQNQIVLDPFNSLNQFITAKEVSDILAKVGIEYIPHDLSLIQRAFIHKTYTQDFVDLQLMKYKNMSLAENTNGAMPLQKKSYERLEFLGDSVVGLTAVSYLWTRFFDQGEGVMTRLKSRLVNTTALANFAEYLGLDRFIILSKQLEEKNMGRKTSNIMEDVFEAFIGALYEDINNQAEENEDEIESGKGYEICRRFIVEIMEEEVDFENLILNDINYKNKLQEYYQYNFQMLPTYKDIRMVEKDGAQTFTVAVLDKRGNIYCTASANSKKQAEQNVAKIALQKFKSYSM